MKRIAVSVFNHWYGLLVLLGMTSMFGFRDWYSLCILLVLYISLISFKSIKKWKSLDYLVLTWLLYCLFTTIWTPVKSLAYYAVKLEIIPILFYFIARGKYCGDDAFLRNMRIPLLFAFVSALFLFAFPPSWYVAYKTEGLEGISTSHAFFERTRLSGFWPWSYFIGYSTLFFIMWEVSGKVFRGENKRFFSIGILVALLCLFLAQQRASILGLLVFIVLVIVFRPRGKKGQFAFVWPILFAVIVGAVLLYFFLTQYFDIGYLEYIIERSTGDSSDHLERVSERFSLFDSFVKRISFFGLGIGYVGHPAFDSGLEAVTDCDYIRIPTEYGILGAIILFTILISALLQGFKHIRHNFFYVSVLVFLFISMIGAAPLELTALGTYLYWYCIGRIADGRRLRYVQALAKRRKRIRLNYSKPMEIKPALNIVRDL